MSGSRRRGLAASAIPKLPGSWRDAGKGTARPANRANGRKKEGCDGAQQTGAGCSGTSAAVRPNRLGTTTTARIPTQAVTNGRGDEHTTRERSGEMCRGGDAVHWPSGRISGPARGLARRRTSERERCGRSSGVWQGDGSGRERGFQTTSASLRELSLRTGGALNIRRWARERVPRGPKALVSTLLL